MLEAQAAIAQGANRLVRYGRGSPYFDIRLPCGTGLDLYFDQGLDLPQLAAMMQLQASRRPFVLRTDLTSGVSRTITLDADMSMAASRRVGDIFERVYPPKLQLLLIGGGPALVSIAALAATLGIELLILSPDEAVRTAFGPFGGHRVIGAADLKAVFAELDFASAAVLVFHDHRKGTGLPGRASQDRLLLHRRARQSRRSPRPPRCSGAKMRRQGGSRADPGAGRFDSWGKKQSDPRDRSLDGDDGGGQGA